MKINSSIFTLALTSVLAIAGCTEQLGDNSSEINGGVPFSFSASHSDSKTSIEGLQTVWDADDDVNLFHAEAGSTSYVNDNAFVITSQNLSTNTFTGTLAAAIEEGKAYDWYVFYPYSEYNKTPAGTAKENSAYITIGGISQIQKGNNSLAHLSGKSCPLFGVAKSVAASSKLSLTMKHLTSIVEVKVSNNSGAPVKVNSVAFTASKDIVGTYYVNYSNPEDVKYVSTGDSYVSETASLSVNSGEEIANGATATFYIAIKPFTAPAGSELKVSVNGDEQIYPITGDVTFNPGKIKTVKYSIDLPASDEPYPYSESFAADMGKFSINDVSLPSELTYVWIFDSQYGMKASARKSNTNYASESWLISPVIDMSKAVKPELSFENVARYGSNSNHTLWAREKDGEWAQLTISNYGSGKDWTFVKNTIDVSAYAGKTLQFAFKYVSTTTGAGTWEIKNIKLDESSDVPAVLESISWTGYTTAYTVGDAFKKDGTVTATYSDGSTEDVSSAASFSTPDMSTAGTKTVTVSYEGKTTTGTITVEEGTQQNSVTFDFSDPESLGLTKPSSGAATNITSPIVSGDVTLTTTNGSAATRIWNSSSTCDLRVYASGGSMTFSVPEGDVITKIVFTGNAISACSSSVGSYSSGTWTGSSQSVKFTATNGLKITDATVYYASGEAATSIISDDIAGVPARGVSAGTSTYSIENPVAGTAIAAKCDGTVVTSVNVADGLLTYAVSANKTTTARSGSITLTYGSVTKVVNVSQLAPAFRVSRTSVELEADADASSSITVTSDFSWTAASSSGAGFEFSPASCTWTDANYTDGKTTVTISAKAANASEDGTKTLGTLTFTNAETSQVLEVTVTQKSSYVAPGAGTDVTFTMTTDGDFSGGVTTATKDVITLAGGQGSYSGNINVGSTYTKVYAGNTLTLSATTGTKITKVVFTATSNYIKTWTADDTTECVVKSSDNTMTWENADGVNSVTFTNTATGQARIKTVVVTYN